MEQHESASAAAVRRDSGPLGLAGRLQVGPRSDDGCGWVGGYGCLSDLDEGGCRSLSCCCGGGAEDGVPQHQRGQLQQPRRLGTLEVGLRAAGTGGGGGGGGAREVEGQGGGDRPARGLTRQHTQPKKEEGVRLLTRSAAQGWRQQGVMRRVMVWWVVKGSGDRPVWGWRWRCPGSWSCCSCSPRR